MTKICTQCKIEKNLDQFYKNKKGKFGLHSFCISCTKIYQKSDKIKKQRAARYKKYSSTEEGKIAIKKRDIKHRKTEKYKQRRLRERICSVSK